MNMNTNTTQPKGSSWYQIVDIIKVIQPSIPKVCRFVILSTLGMSEHD